MPLSPDLDEKVRRRFAELIKEGTELVALMEARVRQLYDYASDPEQISVYVTQYNSLAVRSRNLLRMVFQDTAEGKEYQRRIDKMEPCSMSAEAIVGDLTGLQSDYENGFLDDLQERVVAEISADYMGQAEAMLNDETVGKYGPVGCAVLVGVVLEDRLRRWCERQTPALETRQKGGKNKTLGPLIEEVRRKKRLENQILRQLQWWADIRNHAAHGESDRFSREQVDLMVRGVDNFLANELT